MKGAYYIKPQQLQIIVQDMNQYYLVRSVLKAYFKGLYVSEEYSGQAAFITDMDKFSESYGIRVKHPVPTETVMASQFLKAYKSVMNSPIK